MTQYPHDEFVKEYLPEFLQDYGEVTPSLNVHSETRQIDVWFVPNKPVPSTPETLGLLGKLAQTTCLFEVYRNAIQSESLRDCLGKLISVQQNQLKQNKKVSSNFNNDRLARLWIITPTISQRILTEFAAQSTKNWEKGVYFLPKGLFTGIVAVHQLPVTRSTLWLRILGKGKVQLKAIEELKSLSANYGYRDNILELIYGLLETLENNAKKSGNLDSLEKEVIMSLRTAFREKLAETEQNGIKQGIQQGIQQGKSELVISLLKRKFAELSPELELKIKSLSFSDLENLGETLLDFNSTTDLINWLKMHSP